MELIISAKRNLVRPAILAIVFLALFSLAFSGPAYAQKEKKKKKNDVTATNAAPVIPLPDEQQIDYRISEMLGAWQLGDVERLHQTYADDVVFVSGVWEPPVFGWANFLPLYQRQRARMQQVRMDRTNTYIKVDGTVGWACYQWDFAGNVEGQPSTSKGQTTLVLEKRNSRWMIVHNHTSISQPMPGVVPQTQPPAANSSTPQQAPPSKPPR